MSLTSASSEDVSCSYIDSIETTMLLERLRLEPMRQKSDYGSLSSTPSSRQVGEECLGDTAAVGRERGPSGADDDAAQAGVKEIEAVSEAWTTWSLAIAYAGYVLET